MLRPIPSADEPVKIKNAFEIFVNLALAAKTIRAIPNSDNTTLRGIPTKKLEKGKYILKYMPDTIRIKKANIIQKITTVEI
jgi:hypothetical protein